jgi:hypothetical protein
MRESTKKLKVVCSEKQIKVTLTETDTREED